MININLLYFSINCSDFALKILVGKVGLVVNLFKLVDVYATPFSFFFLRPTIGYRKRISPGVARADRKSLYRVSYNFASVFLDVGRDPRV